MLKLLVIGGGLQGIEALYLARKAGYATILVDRCKNASGRGLADCFVVSEVSASQVLCSLFRKADLVLPALENATALRQIQKYGELTHTPVIFDLAAYEISSSKSRSNKLFARLRIPTPEVEPKNYPLILKPDGASGSTEVVRAESAAEVIDYLAGHRGSETIIEEYLEGRSFSLEVIGDGECFYFPQITEIITDEAYDCKQVIAPAVITLDEKRQFYEIACRLAAALPIKGIFDIEVISHRGRLKVLEIDARLPSQTPISIYHASGMNFVEMMANLTLGKGIAPLLRDKGSVCCYQQIRIADGVLQLAGERIMKEARSLKLIEHFYGADEVITDYYVGSADWRAIVIITAGSEVQAQEKFKAFIGRMQKKLKLEVRGIVEENYYDQAN